jgi:two-component system, cell cycle response regulator
MASSARRRNAFAAEPPTTELRALRTPGKIASSALPQRDHATLTFVEGPTSGTVFGMRPGNTAVLGRGGSAEVHVPDGDVSREHARIRWEANGYVIDPLGATGTWLEGEEICATARLSAGSRIQLGPNVRMRFDLHDEQEQRVLLDLHEAAMRDGLTGAYTRRYLRERLHAELSYAARHRTPLALLMADLDHFKSINDRYGHPAGDEVLKRVAGELRRLLRPEDVLVRWGGEELCVLVRGLHFRNATLLAERLRRAVRKLRVNVGADTARITISIGVTAIDPELEQVSAAELVIRADRALYRAKAAGRDRVCTDRRDPG